MSGAPKNARYLMSLDDGGAFLVTDRKAIHKRTARFLPVQFVYGQGGFDERTMKYPDYVHGQLWALHDCRQRAQLERSVKLLPGLTITEV